MVAIYILVNIFSVLEFNGNQKQCGGNPGWKYTSQFIIYIDFVYMRV